jgi:hypothetical protein
LLAAVEQIDAELEAQRAEVIGAAQVDGLRRDLLRVLSQASAGPVRPL